MKQHQDQIQLTHLADAQVQPSSHTTPLQFKLDNHDDILQIMAPMQQAQLFDEQTTQAFVLDLKLFSEVILENRQYELFQQVMLHFKNLCST